LKPWKNRAKSQSLSSNWSSSSECRFCCCNRAEASFCFVHMKTVYGNHNDNIK
jgi:hypothetical protein